jgi:hypothetical protein
LDEMDRLYVKQRSIPCLFQSLCHFHLEKPTDRGVTMLGGSPCLWFPHSHRSAAYEYAPVTFSCKVFFFTCFCTSHAVKDIHINLLTFFAL